MTRRANFHDYTLAGIYMFTIFRHQTAPSLSQISGDPQRAVGVDAPRVVLLPTGRILDDEIQKTMELRSEQLCVIRHVIMPDHAHILLRVKEKIAQPVTKIVAAIESATTRRCREAGLINHEVTIFKGQGMNDRIVFDERQLDTLVRYIQDNPRRLLIKRMYPDLFRRHLSVSVNGETVDCVGNLFLLRKQLMAVHVRRKWGVAQAQEYKRQCILAARQGVVPVSPFIHPIENEIRKEVLEEGGSVIQIVDHGFSERFKPTGKGLDTCAEGRLLLISEAGASERSEEMSYKKASRLNRLAEHIAALTPASAVALRK